MPKRRHSSDLKQLRLTTLGVQMYPQYMAQMGFGGMHSMPSMPMMPGMPMPGQSPVPMMPGMPMPMQSPMGMPMMPPSMTPGQPSSMHPDGHPNSAHQQSPGTVAAQGNVPHSNGREQYHDPQYGRERSPRRGGGTGIRVLPNGRQSFADDSRKLSTTYRSLGMLHVMGEKRCTPKRFRCSLCSSCDAEEYPMVKVSQLDDEHVDLLVFCLSGVLPNTRVVDLGVTYKGEARDAIRAQFQVKLKKNQSRLNIMSEELDNLPMVALRLGYPAALFSPQLGAAYSKMRSMVSNPPVPSPPPEKPQPLERPAETGAPGAQRTMRAIMPGSSDDVGQFGDPDQYRDAAHVAPPGALAMTNSTPAPKAPSAQVPTGTPDSYIQLPAMRFPNFGGGKGAPIEIDGDGPGGSDESAAPPCALVAAFP